MLRDRNATGRRRGAAILLAAGLLWAAGAQAGADRSATQLRRVQREFLEAHGGEPRRIPLEAKARHFEEVLWTYHRTPWRQVDPKALLPDEPDGEIIHPHAADASTWNGALLAALSYEYAVTRRPATLARIEDLLEGLHLFQEVTGTPGLAARFVARGEETARQTPLRWVAPDGTPYVYRAEPAKGTYTQLVLGYATLLSLLEADLSDAARRRARDDLAALVVHLVRNDYRITALDGRPTRYGNLRPQWLWYGLPFNAQVSTMIVSAGHHFPPVHIGQRDLVDRAFERLRERHPYYHSAWRPPFFPPQRVGRSRFVDANDLNHVVAATYTALQLELHAARREDRARDVVFLHQLGQTLSLASARLSRFRNSLATFMWAAVVTDPDAAEAILGADRVTAERALEPLLADGVEQLRRFGVDRFRWTGREHRGAPTPQWIDAYRPDAYHWKVEPDRTWEVTGPPTNLHTAAIDYLHAYWLFRYHGLDRHPAVRASHAGVLGSALAADTAPPLPRSVLR